jgi:hypothetical protein
MVAEGARVFDGCPGHWACLFIVLVQVLQSKSDLSRVEAAMLIRELSCLPEMREKLTSKDVLEKHVEVHLILGYRIPVTQVSGKCSTRLSLCSVERLQAVASGWAVIRVDNRAVLRA